MSYNAPPPPHGAQPVAGQGHPKGTLALVLAIVSYLCGGLLLSIPAYIIANNASKEPLGAADSKIKIAKILALINIVLGVIGIIVAIIVMASS